MVTRLSLFVLVWYGMVGILFLRVTPVPLSRGPGSVPLVERCVRLCVIRLAVVVVLLCTIVPGFVRYLQLNLGPHARPISG